MKINLQFYNHKKNKIIQYANVDLSKNNFKIIFSNFLKLTSTLEWKSFVFYNKNLILVEGHQHFYNYKYNIEYTSLAIVIGCELYEVFMEKESLEKPIRERTTCIPGITTSKLIYNPYENNSFR